MNSNHKKLFEPIKIGNLEIKNRTSMAPRVLLRAQTAVVALQNQRKSIISNVLAGRWALNYGISPCRLQ